MHLIISCVEHQITKYDSDYLHLSNTLLKDCKVRPNQKDNGFTVNKMDYFHDKEMPYCITLGIMYCHDIVCFFMLLFINFVFTISKCQHQLV